LSLLIGDTDTDLGDVIAGLTRHIGNIGDMLAASTMRPRLVRITGMATADAAGNALIVMDPCPQGSAWDLFQIVIGGVTWATTAAGAAIVFTASSPPASPDTPVALWNVEDEAPTLPNLSYYMEHQVELRPAEALCALVTGATTGQQYAMKARFLAHTLT
jgi:hypothetical protein